MYASIALLQGSKKKTLGKYPLSTISRKVNPQVG
jgi:hypothetical protein